MKIKSISNLASTSPVDVKDIEQADLDREILRTSVIAELDAINLYEQMANRTKNPSLKKVLLSVAKEEKTHVGEFEALLIALDTEYKKELEKGAEEVA